MKNRFNLMTGYTCEVDESVEESFSAESSVADEEEVLEPRNVLESVGSNASTISMSSAIRSLKEELKKLSSPGPLKAMNCVLIWSVILLAGLMTYNGLAYHLNVTRYLRSVIVTVEAMSLQTRLGLAYDGLLLVEALQNYTEQQSWRNRTLL